MRLTEFNNRVIFGLGILLVFLLIACKEKNKTDQHKKMIQLLSDSHRMFQNKDNPYSADAQIAATEERLRTNLTPMERLQTEFMHGNALLNRGREQEAIVELTRLSQMFKDPYEKNSVFLMRTLALAHLRLGERQNCLDNHSPESCIVPIRGGGIHKLPAGSKTAIEIYSKVLESNPEDYEAMWLMNIAYMTLGEYPHKVPKKWLVSDMDADKSGGIPFNAFIDVAPKLGLNFRNNAGGTIVEDFNGDGYLDLITSNWELDKGMHYFRNDGKGNFTDLSIKSGLSRLTGGLNMIYADYDNDGDPDIFVLRGGWCERYGRQPNSLLRNNGDETFTDVTIESGLLSMHPTQTGAWCDFNNDGWLDLFIGNESSASTGPEPCELFINDKKGKFTEVAVKANCNITDYIKSVAAGDYDNDGLTDIFLTSAAEQRRLLRNTGIKENIPIFRDVTREAGLDDVRIRSFPSWFWDYNNDGWLDIFICGYAFGESVAHTLAAEAKGVSHKASRMYLYKNNQDGTFTNVSKESGLYEPVFAMGSNFGDIDNDGFLDMYLGTGNPLFNSLSPNKLFKNLGNGKFADVTVPARVGNLQKGHGVAICDIDNDGDQDIFIEVGGAYQGDTYQNSLYLNPCQNTNNWINIRLYGSETNRSAIGSRLKLLFSDNGIQRTVYRDVNTGGSFGCSSLRREIGIGQAVQIDELEITWQKSGRKQSFKNIKPNQFLSLKEGENEFKIIDLKAINFIGDSSKILMCKPIAQ